jgi:uncharacterized OB-fold protein
MSEERDYCYTVPGKMALPYQYFAGAVGSKFIVALRDEKKILAVRGEKTGTTYLPPRQVCDRTFEDLTEKWVEVSDEGVVTGFTVVRYSEPYQPKEPPFVMALVKLDGVDTAIVHLLECADVADAKVGMRVKAVFAEERQNNILEIQHFVPLG